MNRLLAILTSLDNQPAWMLTRVACKYLGRHGAGCRGRRDHVVADQITGWPGRWYA